MTERKPTCVACKGAGGGATYTAGTGIVIESNEISADTSVLATKSELPDMNDYQPKLTAGTGIDISENVISADIPGDFHIIAHTDYSTCFEPYDSANRRVTVKKDVLIQIMYQGGTYGSASYSLIYLPKGTVLHGDGYIVACNRTSPGGPVSVTITSYNLMTNGATKEIYVAYTSVSSSNGLITIKYVNDSVTIPCLDDLNTSSSPTNGYRMFTRE